MVKRDAKKTIKDIAGENPIVVLNGPRQSGKTTLVQDVFIKKPYVNLEDPMERAYAREDPREFLGRFSDGVVLDEIQYCPNLFSFIQVNSDKDGRCGLYILTGSSQFNINNSVSQSLAGRAGIMTLLPFSYQEITRGKYTGYNEKSALPIIFSGGYPPLHDRKVDITRWCNSYIHTYIEKDVRQIINIQDIDTFMLFLQLCAGNIGQLCNLNRLASDAGISLNTAKKWLSVLKESYICFTLQPHYRNFRKRLVKTAKLYFYDTGIACALLKIQAQEQLMFHTSRGALFENWIILEYMKTRFNKGLESNLYFWRNSTGDEIDLLIDEGVALRPIEIKSGTTIVSDWFKPLQKWCGLAGKMALSPTLIFGGTEKMKRNNIKILPWNNCCD